MKPAIFTCLIFILLNSLAFDSQALDIDEAYRLIPHQQTTFESGSSNIPKNEIKSVNRLLSLAELAMVERVNALKNGANKSHYFDRIDKILNDIENLEVEQNLQEVHQLIQTSIQQHRAYFETYKQTSKQSKTKKKQLIQGSHRNLIKAYNLLMKAYPQETKHNKQAFFDYLCALDFI
jgi:hypothetical protein